MLFKIEKELIDIGGIYSAVIVANGVDNSSGNEIIEQLLDNEITKTIGDYFETTDTLIKDLDLYKQAMEKFGINSKKFPCSIYALIDRIVKKKKLPNISPIVDLVNYISIKYRLPVGVHDVDTFKGDLCVRRATEEDCLFYNANIESDALLCGEPIYISGNSVRTRRWFWRQTPIGRIDTKSKNLIFVIDGFDKNKDRIDAATAELSELLETVFKVETSKGVVDVNNHEFKFGYLTKEEQEIEDQIAIILKGVAQHTSEYEIREKLIEARKNNRPLRVKLGLDPSAPDIHLGHSVVLRKIRQIQDLGHLAIIIIGDYTGMIGDPTGKSKTRKQLSRKDVEQNANTYMEQIFKIIDRKRTEVYYNSEWLSKMSFGDVIELAAKCTVARMMERDDFNNRFTNHLPLSVHEFFYPLMQAYDSVAVSADIELGGTDQTFNILMGRNIQKDYGQPPQLTLFMPLLEGIDGVEKMSKSLGNYVGINEKPETIYSKVMKIPDNLIIKYYNLCTDVHPNEISKLQRELDEGVNPRDVKMQLAYEITKLYYSDESAAYAEQRFKSLFQKNQVPKDAPQITIYSNAEKNAGEMIMDELVTNKYYKSKSEIRRIFNQGGVTFNDKKVTSPQEINLMEDETYILKIGKHNYFYVKLRK